MNDLNELLNKLKQFRDDRDWNQFHNPKDLSIALSVEVSELLELFLWKKPQEADLSKVKEELADIWIYSFLLADKLDINIKEAILDKLMKNSKKYPIAKAKGNARKYNEL